MKPKLSTLVCLLFFMNLSIAQELTKDVYLAIKNDNVNALKNQINSEDYNLCYNIKDDKYALLSLTIKAKATKCFDFLVSEKSIDLNINCSGKTPLLYAAKYGQLDMLKRLIKKGADTTYKNKGKSALDYAKRYGHKEIVSYFQKNN